MNEVVPRKELEQNAMTGIGGIGGGLALLLIHGVITTSPVIGLLVTAGLLAGGYSMSKSKEDRTAGKVTMGAGLLTGAAMLPFVGGLASGLISLAGVGLVGLGGWSIYKFIKGMRSRQ